MVMMSTGGPWDYGEVWSCSEWRRPDGGTEIREQPIMVLQPATREDYEACYSPDQQFPHEPDSEYYFVSVD